MIGQKRYFFQISYCGFWEWDSSSKKGEVELIFNKWDYETSYSLDGVSENNFYNAWLDKINKLIDKSRSTDFEKTIEDWCKRIIDDYTFEKKEIERFLLQLNQDSLRIVKEILIGHNQQYEIILNNCLDYSSFINAVDFLEHLPYRLKEIVANLLENQEQISIHSGKVNDNYTLLEGKIEPSVEKVGDNQLFLFGGGFYGH